MEVFHKISNSSQFRRYKEGETQHAAEPFSFLRSQISWLQAFPAIGNTGKILEDIMKEKIHSVGPLSASKDISIMAFSLARQGVSFHGLQTWTLGNTASLCSCSSLLPPGVVHHPLFGFSTILLSVQSVLLSPLPILDSYSTFLLFKSLQPLPFSWRDSE